MSHEDAIVRPVSTGRSPRLGPRAVLAASDADVQSLRKAMVLPDSCPLYMSRLYYNAANPVWPVVAGPIMGAPYAAMLLEILRAWGVRKALFLGWCGSIDPGIRIGDIIIPSGAYIDEGTSVHYNQCGQEVVRPDATLEHLLGERLSRQRTHFHSGSIWTTDAIFRETPTQVRKYQRLGAVAVEMELSALLAVAAFYTLPMAAVLTVSDELSTFKWRTGFKADGFKQSRLTACRLITDLFGPENDTIHDEY